jgi:hypothetical protein
MLKYSSHKQSVNAPFVAATLAVFVGGTEKITESKDRCDGYYMDYD